LSGGEYEEGDVAELPADEALGSLRRPLQGVHEVNDHLTIHSFVLVIDRGRCDGLWGVGSRSDHGVVCFLV